MSAKYRIGVDVGGKSRLDHTEFNKFNIKPDFRLLLSTGTNADAVVLKCTADTASDAILAWHKSPTTPDVTDGIASALDAVLNKSQINKSNIAYLSIGTTRKFENHLGTLLEFDLKNIYRFPECCHRSRR